MTAIPHGNSDCGTGHAISAPAVRAGAPLRVRGGTSRRHCVDRITVGTTARAAEYSATATASEMAAGWSPMRFGTNCRPIGSHLHATCLGRERLHNDHGCGTAVQAAVPRCAAILPFPWDRDRDSLSIQQRGRTDATAGIHRGARRSGGVAVRGAGANRTHATGRGADHRRRQSGNPGRLRPILG
jgi:hypothetical protein